ncbi:MAG: Apolipoprotein N-acyltransferase [Chlamydiales bacterium]|nr:Apolipoprotein N-acyltransferase [Chlamydiales bacterium]MCH9635762.1 Apolipoprotein N-acyltransferase [Chlamydiales bacterium]
MNWYVSTAFIGPILWLGYVVLISVKGAQFGLLTLFVARSRRIFALAGSWVLMEWLCLLFVFSGYAFDPVGLALTSTVWGLQCASLCGALGLSFWVIATNLLVLRGKKWPSIFAIALPFLYGGGHLLYHGSQDEKSITALLVQSAVSPDEYYGLAGGGVGMGPANQLRHMLELLAPYQGEAVDLIVFPEAAISGDSQKLYFERAFADHILNFYLTEAKLPQSQEPFISNSYFTKTIANTFNADVLIGLNWGRYNAACLFQSGKDQVQAYAKQQLVPFGEYMPMRGLLNLPLLRQIAMKAYSVGNLDYISDFEPGREATVLGGRYGMSVCYEELNGALMIKSRRNGATMHVNISNDGWFPNSRLPIFHYYHARLRSVEQGVPQLRVGNTGVTCALDCCGREIAKLPYETSKVAAPSAVLKVDVPTKHYRTLYSLTGNWLIVAFALLALPKKQIFTRVSRLWKRDLKEL